MKITIFDEGDHSVGIGSSEFVIETPYSKLSTAEECYGDKECLEEARDRWAKFFKEEFDLIGRVAVLFDNENFEDAYRIKTGFERR